MGWFTCSVAAVVEVWLGLPVARLGPHIGSHMSREHRTAKGETIAPLQKLS